MVLVRGGVDFLTYDFNQKHDVVITNPPFKIIVPFIERALELANKEVIMFGKLQLLETEKRRELFESTPLKYVYIHSSRVATLPNGEDLDKNGKPWSAAICFAWFVWEIGYEGEPIIRFLKRD